MRAAAIDVGKVRVGLAVADELGVLAHPRPFLDGRDARRAVADLTRLVQAEGISLVLVGLPLTLRGEEGPSARRARQFAESLKTRAGVEIEFIDERWSTREAMGRLREQGIREREARERIDSATAALLLQSWLDARRVDP